MVGEALKGGRLVAQVMSQEGYYVSPPPGMPSPMAFVTSVRLGSAEKMSLFCRAVQSCSPVGSYIEPVPGYSFAFAPKPPECALMLG
jgi:cystathionine beta-lyase family protein involved in aluminum resistance